MNKRSFTDVKTTLCLQIFTTNQTVSHGSVGRGASKDISVSDSSKDASVNAQV